MVFARATLLFLCGLAPYAYLVLARAGDRRTPGSWGDLTSAGALLRHMLRAEYGTLLLGSDRSVRNGNDESGSSRLQRYLMHASRETLHVGPALAALGFATLFNWCGAPRCISTTGRCSATDDY